MDESAEQTQAVNFRVARSSRGQSRKPASRNLHIPASERLNNLPARLSSFLGRAGECETIAAMLLHQSVRLLTLTGTGGVGKTRLALEAAGASSKTGAMASALYRWLQTRSPNRCCLR